MSFKHTIIVIAALSVMLFSTTIQRDFWYPDEPDMAEITRLMLRSGDWIRLQLYNGTFADYPPLFFWAAAAMGRLFGLSEVALRLPTLMSAVALLVISALFAKRRFGERTAFWSVVVLGTATQFVWQAVNMHVDMLFALLIAASLFCYDHVRSTGSRRARLLLLCGTGLLSGLAALTKGPAGIVLPFAIIAADHLLHKEYRSLRRLLVIGAAGVGVFCIWAAIYAAQAGQSNLIYFIFRQNISRFLTGFSHLQPWYYYITNVWIDLAPWSIFLVFAIPFAWKASRKGDRSVAFVLLWLAVIFIFFNLSRSKRQVYLLPLYPAAAMLMGHLIADLTARATAREVRIFRAALLPIACAFAGIGCVLPLFLSNLRTRFPESHGISIPIVLLSLTCLAGGAAMIVWLCRRHAVQALYTMPIVSAAMCVIGLGWFCPLLDQSISAKEPAHWLASQIKLGEVLACLRPFPVLHNESSVLSFYGGFPVEVITDDEDISNYAARHPGHILLIEDKDMPWALDGFSSRMLIVREMHIGRNHFLAVRLSPGVNNRRRGLIRLPKKL
ncbi:MAG TPA: glycosyltransferase family 39 protein [Planctomycetota bacterium]|nr:glycosyltransferase family 39 protein [Planctomycetota bacterium]